MSKDNNPCVQAIVGELDACRIPYTVEVSGGSHAKIKWQAGQHKRLYFTGWSPSDWRAPKKARADVRRMLKQDGVLAGK